MKIDKLFVNQEYAILFNTNTGFEMIHGVNGKGDPFALELPSLIDVGVMGHCKNKCPFCYQGHEDQPNMKLEDFKRIIDEIKHHTNQVALGGRGDPNHHEDFKEIVKYSRKNGVVPNYTTSGINLTDEQIEASKLCGAVAVSDYGRDHTYNALQRLMDADIKTNIHMIYSAMSHPRAVEIISGLDPWEVENNYPIVDHDKLNAVIFLLFKPAGAGAKLDWVPRKEQLHTFANIVFNPKSKFKIGMDSCLINHVLQYAEPNEVQRMSIDSCEGGRMSAYITPDMLMKPCSFAKTKDWTIPIDGVNNIKDIWTNTEPFKQFREILRANGCCCPLNL